MWGTACADVEVHRAARPTSPTSEKQPLSLTLTRTHTGGYPFSCHVKGLMGPTFAPVHEWKHPPWFSTPLSLCCAPLHWRSLV